MFAPTKTWRKWHVKVNQNQKRYAVASAIAASALPSLVLARGHRIEQIQEVPLVIASGVESTTKTKAAVELLKTVSAYADVAKVADSRKVRAGKGKMRNRRYRQRRGPLVVYEKDEGIVRAFKNVPGVETCPVDKLNLLQLAPGGHVGRFIIWTESAIAALDGVYERKSGFNLPTAKISTSDVTRLINSDEIQSVVRPAGQAVAKRKLGYLCSWSFSLMPQDPSPRRRTPSETRPSSSDSTPTPRPSADKSSSDRSERPRAPSRSPPRPPLARSSSRSCTLPKREAEAVVGVLVVSDPVDIAGCNAMIMPCTRHFGFFLLPAHALSLLVRVMSA
jgi:large subunit ribosomal protein L4e